jgi:hypothetical protein
MQEKEEIARIMQALATIDAKTPAELFSLGYTLNTPNRKRLQWILYNICGQAAVKAIW